MKKIIRKQYRATLKSNIDEKAFLQAEENAKDAARFAKEAERLLTCGMFRYNMMLFLYVEYIVDEEEPSITEPSVLFAEFSDFLCKWPEMEGEKEWIEMLPVFWFDSPVSVEQWRRKQEPDKRCGRIAVLYPEKVLSYVCHHQAIAKEGLLKGDRYQSIALHENILFSYFETPRDREVVNIKREDGISFEIDKWENADPFSHFYHFPEAAGENFLIIPTVFEL